MSELMMGVNGNIIRWAREYLNISLEEANTSLHISIEKYKSYDISPQLYKHRLVGDDLFKLDPLKILVESDGHPIIDLKFAKFGDVLPQIEYYLTCPTIFGDEEEHEIISYWKFEKRPEYTAVCHKVTIDGEEVPVLDRGDRGFSIILTCPQPIE